MIKNLIKLFKYTDKKRKNNLLLIVGLTVITSLMEILSIGSIIPILAILLAPVSAMNFAYQDNLKNILIQLGVTNELEFVVLVFTSAVLITCLLRLKLVRLNTKFSYGIGIDLGNSIYSGALSIPYESHLTLPSSILVDALTNKVLNIVFIVMMAINLISSIILLFLLISVFIFVDWAATIIVVSIFGVMYYAITVLTKHKLKMYSDLIGKLSTQQVKISQESSRGIREILVSNSRSIFISIFKACNYNLREAQARNHFYSLSPRYTVEAAGIILLVTLAYILIGILKNPSAFLILAAIAFSAQRLLPLMQQAYVAWATIKGNQNSLNDVLSLIEKFSSESIAEYPREISKGEITFNHQINIQNISFSYKGSTKNILNNVSINIVKGQFIGIIGVTGSGKSTFIDIFLGLLEPAKGKMFLDGKELLPTDKKEWRKKIAHVPQSIFIADSTILENIAFGVIPDEVDHELVTRVAKIACLDDFIKNLPEGYRSRVGESGSALSGGQKQRIGIARALYKRAEILVLDEATSALDSATEEMVMSSLLENQDNLTIISIAHRISTLQKANKVVNLVNGNIYEVKN